jgi:hypothetical protein
MKKLAKRLTQEITNDKERVEKIFYFVQSHFKTDFASRSIFDPAESIFSRQVGSSAEVTGIIYALLKAVEIESTPVLVPNGKIVIDLPDVPMLDWFSHLLLKVTLDGEDLWLDPLHQTNSVNCISPEYQGVDGLLVQESNGKLQKMPSIHHSENLKVSITNLNLRADGSIDCESREIYSPCRSAEMKNLLRSQTTFEREDELAKRICEYCPGAMLDSCGFNDLYAYGQDFAIDCRFHSSHYVQRADDLLYLNPNILNRDETAKDFAQPVRIFPIMFDQVKTDIDSVAINLPTTYEVANLPEPIHLENDFGEFRTEYEISGNQLVYKRLLKIKRLLVPQGEYKEVKGFFNRIFEEDQKSIAIERRR